MVVLYYAKSDTSPYVFFIFAVDSSMGTVLSPRILHGLLRQLSLEETVKTPSGPGPGFKPMPRPPRHQSDTLSKRSRPHGRIRPRIFRIRHPWSGTLCQNSQGRCGNHCKKQEKTVKTLLVPGWGSPPRPPGHQSDTLTAWPKRSRPLGQEFCMEPLSGAERAPAAPKRTRPTMIDWAGHQAIGE
ncbi:hypothetical protein Bbelb_020670 [Branchiostoma belcheri]|nr:hypothetical protein Bbelb_020670 [Branchiostoma belcheri]